MTTWLMAMTVTSLLVAVAMSVVAWRASQNEKRLAAARVAALAAAAQVPPEPSASPAAEPRVIAAAAPWRSPAAAPADPAGLSVRLPSEDVPVLAPAVVAAPADAVSIHHGFLGSEAPAATSSHNHQRWLAAAAVVVALVLGAFVILRMSGQTQPALAAQHNTPSLELLSLRHEREGVNLSVAGLVRNPAAASPVERLSAVVLLFDQQGQFITSAKAPIDFLKLTAGDESPFVVKMAAPQTVARYRVSFRTDDGTIPHVDRRGDPPVSAPVALVGK